MLINYKTLNDASRNKAFKEGKYCDRDGSSTRAPDWQGPSWYRFQNPAGTQMPEYKVDRNHCGARRSGWLNGTHPTILGETVNRNVCFNYDDYTPCYRPSEIQIRNCGEFYLYNLPNAPACLFRYCAE